MSKHEKDKKLPYYILVVALVLGILIFGTLLMSRPVKFEASCEYSDLSLLPNNLTVGNFAHMWPSAAKCHVKGEAPLYAILVMPS